MCEVKLSPTSGCGHADEAWTSPVCENRVPVDVAIGCYQRAPSQYRVLRAVPPRGGPRSVDRDCAGRNATSVKDVEPRQTPISVVAERVSTTSESSVSEGNISRKAGTTGVQDHGMYKRSMTEHLRSAPGEAEAKRPWPQAKGQGRASQGEQGSRVRSR